MKSFLCALLIICLVQQETAGYMVEVLVIDSYTPILNVTMNDEGEPTKLTLGEDRQDSWFQVDGTNADKNDFDFKGSLCANDTTTPEGLVAEIIRTALSNEGCYFTAGEKDVRSKFEIEGDAFDQFVTEKSSQLYLDIAIYSKEEDGKEDAKIYWDLLVFKKSEDE